MKKLLLTLGLTLVAIMVSGCAANPPEATQAPTAASTPVIESTPEATQVPTAEPAADTAQSPKAEYRKMTAQEAKARIDSGDELIILDVRTPEEYAQGHIPDAVLLPVSNIAKDAPAQLPDKNAEILVYCRSGNRSRQAAQQLVTMGYTGIFDFGGIIDWPYETVTE